MSVCVNKAWANGLNGVVHME